MARNHATRFETCSCPVAAFQIAKGLGGGAFKKEFAASLDLFYRLPCPETAAVLENVSPELGTLIAQATDFPLSLGSKGKRGSALQGIDEYINEALERLRINSDTHQFIINNANAGDVQVGFHRLRDQAILFERLNLLGKKPPFFKDKRQWLRDSITKDLSCWRIVSDRICIHGVVAGKEMFWNVLGECETPQWYLSSEIMYRLGNASEEFDHYIKSVVT